MKALLPLALLCLFGLTARVDAQAPTITSFSPGSGPVGSMVVIDGTNFVSLEGVTFGGNVQAAGSYTSTQVTVTVPSGAQTGPIIVTTASGSATTATSFIVGTATAPTVTLAATVPTASVSSGQMGEFTFTLSSASANDIVVDYSLGGSAVNGTDYAFLKGSTTIKAGKTTKNIKVTPEGDLGGASKKVVKLTLAAGDGYIIGTSTFEKVKILP